MTFFIGGICHQAEESVLRSAELRDLQQRYEERYGGYARADARLACALFERPYLTASLVGKLPGVSGTTAYQAIEQLVTDDALEEITGNERNREYRAREVFDILEKPPETY